MEVFGYIRFSYLGRSDARLFHNSKDDLELYMSRLYDPERMEVRFHFFEKLCLPSLRAQSDQNFRVFVVASEVMPQEYKTRLESAVADIPQIEILYESNPSIHEALNPIMKKSTGHLREYSVHFRLDDDDALGVNAIKTLRTLGKQTPNKAILTMPKGFALFAYEGQAYILPHHENYIAIGFAFVLPPGNTRNPFNCAHRQIGRHWPSLMDPRAYSYIYVSHEASDTLNGQNRRLMRQVNGEPDYHTHAYQARIQSSFSKAFPGISLDDALETIRTAPAITTS